jgi:hypothetical protein
VISSEIQGNRGSENDRRQDIGRVVSAAPNTENPGQQGHYKTGGQDQSLFPTGELGQASLQNEEKTQSRQCHETGVAGVERGVLMDICAVAQNAVEHQGAGALDDRTHGLQDCQVPESSGAGDQGFFQCGFLFEQKPWADQHDQAGEILDYITPKVSLDAIELKNDPIQKVDLVDQAGGRGGGAPGRIPVDPHEKQKRP